MNLLLLVVAVLAVVWVFYLIRYQRRQLYLRKVANLWRWQKEKAEERYVPGYRILERVLDQVCSQLDVKAIHANVYAVADSSSLQELVYYACRLPLSDDWGAEHAAMSVEMDLPQVGPTLVDWVSSTVGKYFLWRTSHRVYWFCGQECEDLYLGQWYFIQFCPNTLRWLGYGLSVRENTGARKLHFMGLFKQGQSVVLK
jgi:hypothetical protein